MMTILTTIAVLLVLALLPVCVGRLLKSQNARTDITAEIIESARSVSTARPRSPRTSMRYDQMQRFRKRQKKARRSIGFAYALMAFAAIPFIAPQDANAGELAVYPLVTFTHDSNLFAGWPFDDADTEPTHDRIAIGIALEWKSVTVDITQGRSARDCDYQKGCKSRDSTAIQVRWKIGGRRR